MKHAGTGHTFVEIELPNDHGTFVIKDDGDNDSYISYGFDVDGKPGRVGFRSFRKSLDDDEEFQAVLDAMFGQSGAASGNSGGGSSPSFSGPPAFKCDGCNRTWPRGKNQTPDQPSDTCPECDNK